MTKPNLAWPPWLRQRLSSLSLVETPDARRLPQTAGGRWLWLAAIWLASVAALGVVGLLLRLVLKT